ncbi:MAG TPA: IS200/IS605 family transposase [Pirellulales bacterium]|jgi:REP element-mobilizing transposase RayT|nr:IS200/IS605 family transposase [Pirellulales bacterium]
MGHVFHQLYYHFVWATHARDSHIHPSFRPQLLGILNEEAKNRGGQPIRHHAMFDHVHLLVRLPPTVLVSEFIGQVKGAASFRVNHEVQPKFKLQWQEGYGVLTLREDELEKVSRYIDNQEEHHRTGRVSQILERTEEDPAAESP